VPAEYDAGADPRVTASAEEAAMAGLGTDDMHRLLHQLSDDQRDVLLLRVVADLSLEQTAAALGKRVGAVKALQHRALATLRRVLEQAVSL
jgi:RNA polymerase sigma-70 factor (ECF subfamily)